MNCPAEPAICPHTGWAEFDRTACTHRTFYSHCQDLAWHTADENDNRTAELAA